MLALHLHKMLGQKSSPILVGCTLPETNSSHLKMDGCHTIVSFWDGLFSGAMLVLGSASAENR